MNDGRSPIELEAEFYSKRFYLSYSGLNKLLYAPQLFYKHYILQQREERIDTHLVEGKVIHCLLLNDGSFDDLFIVSPSSLPSGNTRLVINKVYQLFTEKLDKSLCKLDDQRASILQVLKEINLHQSLTDDKKDPGKTGDDKRVEKIVSDETRSYWEFLLKKGSKDLIDEDTYKRCQESVEVLRNNQAVMSLLGIDQTEESIKVWNEVPLEMEDPNIPEFGLKGILDNVKADHKLKILYINDLKTSSKTLSEFRESIEYYKYWIQAAIYLRLIKNFLKDQLTEEWSIVFNFIVIDKYQQVYAFPVSSSTMEEWQKQLDNKLTEARWHYENRSYTLPYEFLREQIYL